MKVIISELTRTAFRETYVKCGIIYHINNDFGASGLEQANIPTGRIVYGERRTLVERYYSSVNWNSLSDVKKVLKAYEQLLVRLIERHLTYEFDMLIKLLGQDGFNYHKGTIELRAEKSAGQNDELSKNTSRQLSMYNYIAQIEKTIHKFVKNTLKSKFGTQESGWWRQGIQEDIRKKCKIRLEEDPKPSSSAFNYTDMLDLSKIISKNWSLFQNLLPRNYCANHKALESDFVRLNLIRNEVMHPVKNKNWSKDDFQFVKNAHNAFVSIDCDKSGGVCP